MKHRAVVIIPARYHSTRLPGKVLLNRSGKYLVQHTYEQVSKARLVGRVLIATDDHRVVRAVRSFGGEVVLTSKRFRSGTERVAAIAAKLPYPFVVNVQADEPEINPKYIDAVIRLLGMDKKAGMSSLACPFDKKVDIADPNKVKVVLDKHKYALYFSRSPIPYQPRVKSVKSAVALRHLGIYGYRKDVLLSLVRIPPSPMEKLENLEQLRALENGIRIKIGIVKSAQTGIDTFRDYQYFLQRLREKWQKAI